MKTYTTCRHLAKTGLDKQKLFSVVSRAHLLLHFYT